MSGAFETAGDIATGSVWARVAEPPAGEGHAAGVHGPCLNCGTALTGRYCHACGQSSHVHRTLMSIVHDLLHGVFHFEGKIWRTIPMLVLHPGRLTRRYIDGERAKFVSPLALFLFTVFLMFATFSTLATSDLGAGLVDGLAGANPQVERVRADMAKEVTAAEQARAKLVAEGRPTLQIDSRLAVLRNNVASIDTVRERLSPTSGTVKVHSSFGWLDEGLQRARQNPGLVVYKVQSAAYKFSWVLIFLSTPLLALLFLWRRRYGMYDHATFVTYSISFMSLLVIALELAAAAGVSEVVLVLAIVFVPLIHMFAQLRGAYGLSVFSALWRTVLLHAFAGIALLTFVLGVIMVEVAH
ncbi:DUF3667 domain-containing protein [Sphingomonas sp.]|uniref:DUF3667 domain-containing protein n=1 Tax=Sphingomonas sp. TaxID=28214 RepID=UPI003AFFA135